ncbi:MAG: efflux RND transporter permease subunit [Endomicrobiia bacterium]
MNIPAFSVKRSVTVTMFALIIVVLGIISYTRLGLDMLPDITYPIVSVVVKYPGASPEDIEKLVTKPVEEVIATIKNVKKVTSTSLEGFAILLVEFEWGTNIDLASQDIRDNIDLLRTYLPTDMERPIVLKFDPSMMPVVVYGVTGSPERSLTSLKTITEDMIKDRLEQIDGVASAIVWGGDEREILIEVDKKKLDAYGITMNEIITRLQLENYNLPGGNVKETYKEYTLRTVGEFKDIKEIENIPIGFRSNVPIYLKDVVQVKDTVKEKKALVTTNKNSSVMFYVVKESGANTVIVARKIKKELN